MSSKNEPVYSPETMLMEFDFRKIFLKIISHKWLIAIITSISFCLGLAYSLHLPARYASTALIQVSSQLGTGNSMQQMLGNIGLTVAATTQASPADIEIALIKSSFILQSVIQKLKLNINVRPNYFPLIGKEIARYHQDDELNPPLFGLSQYAWGGEKIVVSRFDIDDQAVDSKLRIQADGDNNYSLYSPDGRRILQGRVGETLSTPPEQFPHVTILISKLRANPGAIFYISLKNDEEILKQLSQNISIIDLGNIDKTKTGVLKILFHGTNPHYIAKILNTIIEFAIIRNIENKSAEASKTLDFLNKQLPNVRRSLESAETDLYEYRAQNGSIDLTQEAKIVLMHLSTIEQSLAELKLKRAEMLQELKPKHPLIVGMGMKEKQLQHQAQLLRKKIKLLPRTDQTALSLERDVKVKSQLYLLLLSKIQQLQVLKAGTLSDIRVLSPATVPVFPGPAHRSFILICSVILGIFVSLVIIMLRHIFFYGIKDPIQVEERLGIDTYGIIPYSKYQKRLYHDLKRQKKASLPVILAKRDPKDLAVEGIRSLRTTLQLTLNVANNNILSILGASPGIGKSFIAINLAQLLVDTGKRVILIDGDMRKGKISQLLNQNKTPGFAELLEGECTVEESIKHIDDGYDFIATGKYPKNPSEMLMSNQLDNLLEQFSIDYDVVLIDTPPILAVTDGIIIAKKSATNLLVIGCHSDNIKELELAVKRVKKNGIQIAGLVFNNKKSTNQEYNQQQYYYAYETAET